MRFSRAQINLGALPTRNKTTEAKPKRAVWIISACCALVVTLYAFSRGFISPHLSSVFGTVLPLALVLFQSLRLAMKKRNAVAPTENKLN